MNSALSRARRALVTLGQKLPSRLNEQLSADAGLINFEHAILQALIAAPHGALRMGELAEAALARPRALQRPPRACRSGPGRKVRLQR